MDTIEPGGQNLPSFLEMRIISCLIWSSKNHYQGIHWLKYLIGKKTNVKVNDDTCIMSALLMIYPFNTNFTFTTEHIPDISPLPVEYNHLLGNFINDIHLLRSAPTSLWALLHISKAILYARSPNSSSAKLIATELTKCFDLLGKDDFYPPSRKWFITAVAMHLSLSKNSALTQKYIDLYLNFKCDGPPFMKELYEKVKQSLEMINNLSPAMKAMLSQPAENLVEHSYSYMADDMEQYDERPVVMPPYDPTTYAHFSSDFIYPMGHPTSGSFMTKYCPSEDLAPHIFSRYPYH
jgi:hypothetical protein